MTLPMATILTIATSPMSRLAHVCHADSTDGADVVASFILNASRISLNPDSPPGSGGFEGLPCDGWGFFVTEIAST